MSSGMKAGNSLDQLHKSQKQVTLPDFFIAVLRRIELLAIA